MPTIRKASEATALTGAGVAVADKIFILDPSDTTDESTGTTKAILAFELAHELAMQSAGTAVLYVSASFTGMSAPYYTTLVLALAAATSGDLIVVYPGTYSGAVTLVDGVNIHLCAGATLSGGVVSATGACSCIISGQGIISRSAGTALDIDEVTTSGEIIVFAKKITAVAAIGVHKAASGVTLKLFVGEISTTSASVADHAMLVAGSGSVYLYHCLLSTDASASTNVLATATGTVECVGCVFTKTGGNTAAILSVDGVLRLRSCRIVNTNNGTSSHGITMGALGVYLSSVEILVTNASAYSVSSSGGGDLVVFGDAVTNRDKNANITVRVGTLTVDGTYVV